MTLFSRIGLIAGALALSAPALAQDNTPVAIGDVDVVTRMNASVNELVADRIRDMLAPGDLLRLLVVSQQAALAANCDGYDLDPQRFGTVMNDIVSDLQAQTDASANNLPVDVVMHAYGISLGGQTAVAAYDIDAFAPAARP